MAAKKEYFIYKDDPTMDGPYRLEEDAIDDIFEDGDEYGVYLLIYETDSGNLIVTYVGRGILRDRLDDHRKKTEAVAFYFKLLDDDYAGFREECRLFHEYGKRKNLDNKNHPPVPRGAPKNFPRCTEVGCRGEAD